MDEMRFRRHVGIVERRWTAKFGADAGRLATSGARASLPRVRKLRSAPIAASSTAAGGIPEAAHPYRTFELSGLT